MEEWIYTPENVLIGTLGREMNFLVVRILFKDGFQLTLKLGYN